MNTEFLMKALASVIELTGEESKAEMGYQNLAESNNAHLSYVDACAYRQAGYELLKAHQRENRLALHDFLEEINTKFREDIAEQELRHQEWVNAQNSSVSRNPS